MANDLRRIIELSSPPMPTVMNCPGWVRSVIPGAVTDMRKYFPVRWTSSTSPVTCIGPEFIDVTLHAVPIHSSCMFLDGLNSWLVMEK